jgi:threonine/homoserine/homoserine lactone efflux protein
MSDTGVLLTIAVIQLLAVISPGPSFLITARTAVARSRRDGVKVALGLGAGTVIWSTAALLGLNALFHAVPALFTAAKVAGAAFLLWVAVQIIRHAAEPLAIGSDGAQVARPFLAGFLTQIANPKVAVFFGSVFVALLQPSVPLWMMAALVLIVTFNEVWWYSAVALFFSTGPVRRAYLAAKTWIDRIAGVFLGALGLRLLWSARDGL